MALEINPLDGKLIILSKHVAKAGDRMTGKLTLSDNPSVDMEAATKQYVDSLKEYVDKDSTITYVSDKISSITVNGETITLNYSGEYINQVVKSDGTNTKTINLTRDNDKKITNVDVTIS